MTPEIILLKKCKFDFLAQNPLQSKSFIWTVFGCDQGLP